MERLITLNYFINKSCLYIGIADDDKQQPCPAPLIADIYYTGDNFVTNNDKVGK